ncbi:MAG: hypothetical protein JXR37_05470 [Kiritimatiellae bacterium]|nr:hypothetical protein [Kiritimatiellia bacterium]
MEFDTTRRRLARPAAGLSVTSAYWRRAVRTFACFVLALVLAGACARGREARILDQPPDTVYETDLLLSSTAEGEDGGEIGVLEAGVHWAAVYLYTGAGNIDLSLDVRGIWFLVSDYDQFPSQAGRLVLETGWTLSFGEDFAIQARAYPGFYGEFEEWAGNSVFVPFSVSFLQTFNADFTGVAGVIVRPGFRNLIMPRIGMAWQISEHVRWVGLLPESRLTCSFSRRWDGYLGFSWENTDFKLQEPEEQMMVEDFRAYAGLARLASDQFRFAVEVGTQLRRTMAFKNAPDVEPDDTLFVNVTLAGF